MCVCNYIYVFMYVCICIYIYVLMYVCMRMCSVYLFIYLFMGCVYVCMYVCVCVCACVCVYVFTFVSICVCLYVCTYVRMMSLGLCDPQHSATLPSFSVQLTNHPSHCLARDVHCSTGVDRCCLLSGDVFIVAPLLIFISRQAPFVTALCLIVR